MIIVFRTALYLYVGSSKNSPRDTEFICSFFPPQVSPSGTCCEPRKKEPKNPRIARASEVPAGYRFVVQGRET